MAEKLCSLKKIGGGKATMELLNTPIELTTSDKTITLSHSIDDYSYIVIASQTSDDFVYQGYFPANVRSMTSYFMPSFIKSASVTTIGYEYSGNQGTYSAVAVLLTYVSDTQIKLKLNAARAGTYAYVYGIK